MDPSAIEPVEGSPAKSIKAVFPALTDFSAPHLSMQASIFVDWRGNVVCNVNSVPFDMQQIYEYLRQCVIVIFTRYTERMAGSDATFRGC